jgi:hypothetical protein
VRHNLISHSGTFKAARQPQKLVLRIVPAKNVATKIKLPYIAKKSALPKKRQYTREQEMAVNITPSIQMEIRRSSTERDPARSRSLPRRQASNKCSNYRKLLTEADATAFDFEVYGAVCRRDNFAEHFNFPQHWSLYPNVSMSTLFSDSPATLNLAVSILDRFFRIRGTTISKRRADARAIALAEQFAAEILSPLAGSSWHLPLESITRWTQAQLPLVQTDDE